MGKNASFSWFSTIKSFVRLLLRPLRPLVTYLGQKGLLPRKAQSFLPWRWATEPFTLYGDGWKCRWFSTEVDSIGHRLFWTGFREWEKETAPEIFRQIKMSHCFFDIGANCGVYSVVGSIINPSLKVFAFEPSPRVFKALSSNVSGNQLQARVTALNMAIGSENGLVSFHECVDATMSSLSVNGYRGQPGSLITVECKTVDAVVENLSIVPDFLKIDVEGFESAVLLGATNTLAVHRPRIVLEANPGDNCAAVSEILGKYDYKFFNITDSGLKQHPELFGVDEFRNWLCLPKEK